MTKFIKIFMIAALALVLGSCTEGDKFDPNKDVLVMTGTDNSPLIKFAVEQTPAVYPVTVSCTGKVSEDVTVNVKIDNSLVEKYNKENKTSYYAIEDSWASLEKNSVVISKGKAASEASNLTINENAEFVDGRIYMIPVTITDVKGGIEVLETSRTVYIRISRVYYFPALDISNKNVYANFIFDEPISLTTHTLEVKFYAYSWHQEGSSEPISRMLGLYNKDEQGYLYRIGENGYKINQLQLNISNVGPIGSSTLFSTGNWYTLSVTYDGSTTRLYVDGVRDAELSGGAPIEFQRVELGMSWGGYGNKQRYDGRIAEIRVWDRALSASEIQLGLCGVDPASEGLKAYWKMNEGEGHIFYDSVGENHMDWSNVWRDSNEDGPLENYDYSQYVTWTNDDKNKCVN